MKTLLTKSQKRTYGPKPVSGYGPGAQITATVRYDDECGNGHNTFAITAEIKSGKQWEAGGCMHEEISHVFPELAPLIKWHLCSSDGPMHYPGNALYHASDRDHRGLLKGEKRHLRNGRTNKPAWERVVRNGEGEGERVSISSSSWVDSDEMPTETLTVSFEPVWIVGEGKERDLEAARHCAIWPEATIEQLLDKEALTERLPALLAEFKTAVESLGFTF